MAEVARYLVRMLDADMNLLKETVVTDEAGDGPGFFAHQSLHASDVSCVEILQEVTFSDSPAWVTVLRRCDPDFEDEGWVAAAGGEDE